jgi:hypothetical protein
MRFQSAAINSAVEPSICRLVNRSRCTRNHRVINVVGIRGVPAIGVVSRGRNNATARTTVATSSIAAIRLCAAAHAQLIIIIRGVSVLLRRRHTSL